MNKALISSLLFSAFLVGCLASFVAQDIIVPPLRAESNAQRWEYDCITADYDMRGNLTPEFKGNLNEFGGQGWELVTVGNPAGNGGRYCFKRPL